LAGSANLAILFASSAASVARAIVALRDHADDPAALAEAQKILMQLR
jgi:hypothetical protein